MHKDLTREEAQALFEEFGGAESLCVTVPNILHIDQLLASLKPQRIVEVGAGRGTITKLMLSRSTASVFAYEHEPTLVKELEILAEEFPGRVTILSYDQFPPAGDCDLVILDGPGYPTTPDTLRWGPDKDALGMGFTTELVRRLEPTTYFVEGHRYLQRTALVTGLKGRFSLSMKSCMGHMDRGFYQKGGLIVRTVPCSSSLLRAINHTYAHARIKLAHASYKTMKWILRQLRLLPPKPTTVIK